MKFLETSKYSSLNKSTYVNLRWIGIIGQIITIYWVKFIFDFKFPFLETNLVVFLGIITNLWLIYFYQRNQVTNRTSFIFLCIDIFQLSVLIYLTGGIVNPFAIFILIPSIFSSIYLEQKTNIAIVLVTVFSLIFLTFFHENLPYPIDIHFHVSEYYFYAFPISLLIALVFFSYFATELGKENRLRKEAIDKMQEIMAKEHELLSLGSQAAAAAHSLNTPLSTIRIISKDLLKQYKNDQDTKKDIDLLVSQVKRCGEIVKKMTLNPTIDDDFLERDLTINEYLIEIIKSFEQISNKKFNLTVTKNNKQKKIKKSIELVYGIRNFVGNANKFAKKNIFIKLDIDNNLTSIIINDDGKGYPDDIINRLGQPYVKSLKSKNKDMKGLGLGIFIGKTLLEKNYAKISFRNSSNNGGAEVRIVWKNSDLKKI